MARTFPKQKKPKLSTAELIEFGAPDLFYSVQQAFQNAGIALIDLDTGKVIEGQVNVSDMGLSLPGKPRKVKRQMGYVQSPFEDSIDYEDLDLDAILTLDPSSQTQDGPFFLIVKVVEDDDREVWTQVLLDLARQFTHRVQGWLRPDVMFGLTSLSRSNGTDSSARETALRKIQRYGSGSVSGISYDFVGAEDTFDDEYDEGEESEV